MEGPALIPGELKYDLSRYSKSNRSKWFAANYILSFVSNNGFDYPMKLARYKN